MALCGRFTAHSLPSLSPFAAHRISVIAPKEATWPTLENPAIHQYYDLIIVKQTLVVGKLKITTCIRISQSKSYEELEA